LPGAPPFGFALGYAAPAAPAAVAQEALGQVAAGYRAVKLRLGDTLNHDMERTEAMRSALPADVALLADANCRYSVDDVRAMLPVLAGAGAGWLEEPFPPYQDRSWRAAAALLRGQRMPCQSARSSAAGSSTGSAVSVSRPVVRLTVS
jgi:D-galactarolactone cycloisomerase